MSEVKIIDKDKEKELGYNKINKFRVLKGELDSQKEG